MSDKKGSSAGKGVLSGREGTVWRDLDEAGATSRLFIV